MKNLSKVKKDEKGHYIKRVAYDTKRKKNYLGKIYGQFKICPICNETHFVSNAQLKLGFGKSCSYHCARIGKNNGHWTGGRIKSIDGYIRIYMPKHPHCDPNNYIYEHRLVMEKYLGRYLKPEERVHHDNDIRDDNRIENFILFENQSEHQKWERFLQRINNK